MRRRPHQVDAEATEEQKTKTFEKMKSKRSNKSQKNAGYIDSAPCTDEQPMEGRGEWSRECAGDAEGAAEHPQPSMQQVRGEQAANTDRGTSTENSQVCKLRQLAADIEAGYAQGANNQINVTLSALDEPRPAILDSGADRTLIPMAIAKRLCRMHPNTKMTALEKPVKLILADSEEAVGQATHEIQVDILLHTRAGELQIRKHTCLVWDVEYVKEIYLGQDLLEELGIDPRTALEYLIASMNRDSSCGDGDEYILDQDEDDVAIGEDVPNDIREGIDNAIARAMKQGLPRKWKRRLRRLAFKRWNVWRTKLGPDPPAKVTPCRTRLRQGARPYRCKARRYSKEQSEFLAQFVSLLKKYGLVYENHNSEWASPVVVVRKPGNRGWRMCVDLREVNKLCEATAWPMPFLEAIVQHLAGSKYWFSLDAFKGFWLMPLAKECQEMRSTPGSCGRASTCLTTIVTGHHPNLSSSRQRLLIHRPRPLVFHLFSMFTGPRTRIPTGQEQYSADGIIYLRILRPLHHDASVLMPPTRFQQSGTCTMMSLLAPTTRLDRDADRVRGSAPIAASRSARHADGLCRGAHPEHRQLGPAAGHGQRAGPRGHIQQCFIVETFEQFPTTPGLSSSPLRGHTFFLGRPRRH